MVSLAVLGHLLMGHWGGIAGFFIGFYIDQKAGWMK